MIGTESHIVCYLSPNTCQVLLLSPQINLRGLLRGRGMFATFFSSSSNTVLDPKASIHRSLLSSSRESSQYWKTEENEKERNVPAEKRK